MLRHDRVDAPSLPNGFVNRDGFLTDIRDMLAPRLSGGAIVVAGTLSAYANHKPVLPVLAHAQTQTKPKSRLKVC